MAYSNFTINQLQEEFGLNIVGRDALFADAPPAALSDWIRLTLQKQRPLATHISTDKARSEFLIAPLIVEIYEQMQERVSLFSGVPFPVDSARGLAGYCDFIFTLAPRSWDLSAPVVFVTQARNEEMQRGVSQCLAELAAAQIFNAAEGEAIPALYGVVTTGTLWKFLKLENGNAFIDNDLYYINQPEKIVGIIVSMLH